MAIIRFDTRANGAVPFWFWNGDQQEEEITRQLELASAGGLKGMAIHARSGNKTEYMSDRWLALTRHTCKEAMRLGLDIWLYDEEGFPSGTVGERLQGNEPTYQQKLLCYDYCAASRLRELEDVIAAYDASTYERIDCANIKDDSDLLVFWMGYLPRYIDALKRDTVERFMDMTHRRYYEELKEYFGHPITHIYTDDLNSYLDRAATLAYTERLPEVFAERFGYSLLDHLPKLVENLPGNEKVRLDYRRQVMDLFLYEFVEPMHRWCEEHGVQFTGHLSGDEGEITKSAHRFGSAMAFYEHEHIPGVDDFLCSVSSGCYLDHLRNRQNHCPVIVFKQASAVANQLKGGACSSECLTFLGWGASVWGQSAFLNYELTLGVNMFVHHDFSYATGEVAKRDCPPSYFFQQPYWPQYKRFHDAIARSTQLLKRGKYAASTLVIHPMSSCWAALDGHGFLGDGEIRTEQHQVDPLQLEESLAAISHELIKLRVGFEYGDEWLLERHGSVLDGQLHVGAMAYTTVVIPEVANLAGTTIDLLEAFKAAGGRVMAVNPDSNCLVDGMVPEVPVFRALLMPEVVDGPEALRDCGLSSTIELTTEEDAAVTCHTRDVDGVLEHFVYNVSDRPQEISWPGELKVYDPVENEGILCASGTDKIILSPFHAVHLLPELPEGVGIRPAGESLFGVPGNMRVLECSGDWRITPEEPNLMLIDWCELSDGRVVYYDDRIAREVEACRCRVVVDIPASAMVTGLAGETETLRDMRINGKTLPPERTQHPSSQDLLLVDVADLLTCGQNEITFKGPGESSLFEPFYLMGEFSVDLVETEHGMRPLLGSPCLSFGDLVDCGLPFYWGVVRYEKEVAGDSSYEWLDCGDVEGVLALEVNGEEVGCRYMAPYRFRIADCLKPGKNSIVLKLYNTAQNLYGPHRRDLGVALHRCEQRGAGEDKYFLAGFGVGMGRDT